MSSSDTPVYINASDGCSELYLVDDKYTVVANGVGQLRAQVAPGLYKVRQRIGDNERSQVVEIVDGSQPVSITLPALPFVSPIPLRHTNTSSDLQQESIFETSITSSMRAGQISIFIRGFSQGYVQDASDRDYYFIQEVMRLGIESLDGVFRTPLIHLGKYDFPEFLFRASIDVPPGHYVLTQSAMDGAQHCMPLEVRDTWAPAVFLQAADQSSNEQPVALDLDHASIVYPARGDKFSPNNQDLLFLEVVRNAFARRRTNLGPDIIDRFLEGVYKNPALGLIGSHLLLDSLDGKADRVGVLIDNTAALLGDEFPDIIALRLKLNELTRVTPSAALPTVAAPPLLAASWAALTRQGASFQSKRTATDISKLFWFPCTVEPKSTWFVWTEACNARRQISKSSATLTRSGAVQRRRRPISMPVPDYESPPSPEIVQGLVEQLLARDGVQDWVRRLKTDERAGRLSTSPLNQLDRGLLTSIASAQASLVPGVIDAYTAASSLVRNLNIPMGIAQRSASNLLSHLVQTRSSGAENLSDPKPDRPEASGAVGEAD